jgi:hypothetical protein
VNLQVYKAIILVVTAVLALLAASPALQRLLVYPQTEFFTELWLLGPGHAAENYPVNLTNGVNYSVFLGIGNHLGQCAYYVVEVKFRNETMSAPNSFTRTPSSLPALYSMPVFVADKETWEQRLTFSFDYQFDAALSRAEFNSLTLNGVTLNLRGLSSEWNATTSRFYGNLIFELWIYSESASSFQYHARFVDLKFNMTRSGFS